MLKLPTLASFFFASSSAWAIATCGDQTTEPKGVYQANVGAGNLQGCLTGPAISIVPGLTPDPIPTAWGDTTIAWNITSITGGGGYRYQYTFSDVGADLRDVSHFIIGLSGNCGSTIGANSTSGTCIWNVQGSGNRAEIGTYNAAGSNPGNSNPGLPNSLYGIKLDDGKNVPVMTVSFESNRVPVWQNFYAKSGTFGTDSANEVYVYNAGFNEREGRLDYYIAAPDSVLGDSVVPEPGFYGLLSIGLVGLYAVARGRRLQE